MRYLPLALVLVSSALLVNGCVTGSHIVTGNKRPPINPLSVKVYGEMPEKAETIGMVTASMQNAGQYATDECIKQLRKSAAKLGANGIVIAGFAAGSGQHGFGVGTGVGSNGGIVTTTGTLFTSPSTTVSATAVYIPLQ